MCLFPLALFADGVELPNAPKCWTVPAVFTADEEVTFYYDMTDVGFQEGVDLYLWAWQPTEPDAGHGGNSSDFAKLEYLGNNIYKRRWYQRSISIVTSLSLKMLTGQASGKD